MRCASAGRTLSALVTFLLLAPLDTLALPMCFAPACRSYRTIVAIWLLAPLAPPMRTAPAFRDDLLLASWLL
eukprot:CAMPEP_0171915286 /NCGR_PEP_ID=MMETSP0993-20121228/13664_1 /TAXON_ID=483369 /ORGANISM="non described non described, Strain CCMP2098" /LENGTH=71 /DNA_ID=CAMNT_0012550195 /DNA_START=90 /DNA_END=301 /DNA_ORIENTATION=+